MNEENKNKLGISEPEWQARFRGEYKGLKERYNKLHKMIQSILGIMVLHRGVLAIRNIV